MNVNKTFICIKMIHSLTIKDLINEFLKFVLRLYELWLNCHTKQ